MTLTKDLLLIALMESNLTENLNGCSSAEKSLISMYLNNLTPKYYTETGGTKIKNHKWKYVHWH